MTLLFLIPHIAYCGAERVLSLLVNELSARNHNIYILTDPNKITYPIDNRVTIIDAYACEQYRMRPLHKMSKLKRGWKALRYNLNQINPDYVISFMEMFIWQCLYFRHRYRIIISDHTSMTRNVSIRKGIERHILPRFFYKYVVLTQSDKDYFKGKLKNIEVIGNPLTFEPISKEEYMNLFPRRGNLLAVGSLDRWYVKGFDLLLKSFSLVVRQYPTVGLDIVGAGSSDNVRLLKGLAQQYGVSGNVRFLGFSTSVDVLMQKYQVLVVSSRVEGFGMAITEAMSNGLPVVSFSLSGPKEIICSGKNGLLVDANDYVQLANSVVRLMLDKQSRFSMGLEALDSVARFSLKNIVNKWEQLFNEGL